MARRGEGGERLRDPQSPVDAPDAQQAAVERASKGLHGRGDRSELSPQQGAADLGVGVNAVRLPALRRGHPGRLHPLADACRGLGLLGGERTGSLRVHLDAQVGPDPAAGPTACRGIGAWPWVRRCSRGDLPAHTGTGWRPAPAGNAPDSAPPRLGEQAESPRLPMEFAAPPVRSRRSRRTRRGTALPGELGCPRPAGPSRCRRRPATPRSTCDAAPRTAAG